MLANIYISFPVSEDMGTLNSIISKVREYGAIAHFWNRGTCYNKKMEDYDAIIIALPNNKFKADFHDVPNGVRLEILSAINSRKKIFLAYKSNTGMNIYETDISNVKFGIPTRTISALAGTSHVIRKFIKEKTEEMKQTSSVKIQSSCSEITIPSPCSNVVLKVEGESFDERLLLS